MTFSIKEWVQAFIEYGRSEKHFSPDTVRAYEQDLTQFSTFLEQEFKLTAATDFSKLTAMHFRSFGSFLMKENQSVSIARKMSTLRTFFRYLKRKKLIDQNWLALIPSPKSERKLPNFLKIEEVLELIRVGQRGLLPAWFVAWVMPRPRRSWA